MSGLYALGMHSLCTLYTSLTFTHVSLIRKNCKQFVSTNTTYCLEKYHNLTLCQAKYYRKKTKKNLLNIIQRNIACHLWPAKLKRRVFLKSEQATWIKKKNGYDPFHRVIWAYHKMVCDDLLYGIFIRFNVQNKPNLLSVLGTWQLERHRSRRHHDWRRCTWLHCYVLRGECHHGETRLQENKKVHFSTYWYLRWRRERHRISISHSLWDEWWKSFKWKQNTTDHHWGGKIPGLPMRSLELRLSRMLHSTPVTVHVRLNKISTWKR